MPKITTKELDNRLSRLEDKVKKGLLEVEKKFASSETSNVDERVKEVEDLQLLAQLEIAKLKEKKAETPQPTSTPMPPDLERRLNDVFHRVDALESQKITEKGASYFISRIVKEKRELENEFDRLRSLRKDFDAIMEEKEEISKRVSESEINLEKVDALYTKMKTVEEQASAEVNKIYSSMKAIEDRVDDSIERSNSMKKVIENRIDTSEEKFKLRADKLESLRDSMNAKLSMVDDKIRDLDAFKKLVGNVDAFRASMEDEAIQRMALEKSVQDTNKKLDEHIEKFNTSDINRRLENDYVTVVSLEKRAQDFARRFDDVDARIKSIEPFVNSTVDVKTKQLEARIKDMAEIKQMKEVYAKLDAMQAQLETKLEFSDYTKAFTDMREKLASLETTFKATERADFTKLEAELETLKSNLTKADEEEKTTINKRISEIETVLRTTEHDDYTKLQAELSTLRKSLLTAEKKDHEQINTRMIEIEAELKVIENKDPTKELKEELKKLKTSLYSAEEKEHAAIEKRINEIESVLKAAEKQEFERLQIRLASLERKLLHDEQIDHRKIADEIADIERSMESAQSKLVSQMHGDMENMKKKMDRTDIRETVRADMAIMQREHTDLVNKLHSEMQELKKSQKDMKSKLEEEVLGKEGILDEARQKFEREVDDKIAEFSGKIDELGMKMQLEKEQIIKSLNMDELVKIRNDIVTQKRVIHDIERNLELSAVRFFTENLEEFAREIDRKMPKIVTHDEFSRELKLMDNKVRRIHAPDTQNIEQRLVLVEKKISEIYNLTRNFSAQQAIVVE